jgi:hypothetical protein
MTATVIVDALCVADTVISYCWLATAGHSALLNILLNIYHTRSCSSHDCGLLLLLLLLPSDLLQPVRQPPLPTTTIKLYITTLNNPSCKLGPLTKMRRDSPDNEMTKSDGHLWGSRVPWQFSNDAFSPAACCV